MQVPEPVSTYAKLGELRAVLTDYQRRLKGKHSQDLQAQAASALVVLVNKAMRDNATADVMPRITVVVFGLAHQVVMQPIQGILERLMLGIVAHFPTGVRAEELAHQLLKPINMPVLTN